MTRDTSQKILLGTAALALVGVGAYFLFANKAGEELLSEGESIVTEGGATITVTKIKPPSLDRPIVFPASFPDDVADKQRLYIENLIAELKKDPGVFIKWVDLGLQWQALQDYEGAKEAWEYANALQPESSVAYGNLGNLYGYYLKDSKKAEENFLTALKNSPAEIYLYFQTADFYVQVIKDKNKAIAIVEEGIKRNPGSKELRTLKAELSSR